MVCKLQAHFISLNGWLISTLTNRDKIPVLLHTYVKECTTEFKSIGWSKVTRHDSCTLNTIWTIYFLKSILLLSIRMCQLYISKTHPVRFHSPPPSHTAFLTL